MSIECPHCGKHLIFKDVTFQAIEAVKPVGKSGVDLQKGIVEAAEDAVSAKVRELDERVQAITDLQTMSDNLVKGPTDRSTLANGWGGAMVDAVHKRRMSQDYSPQGGGLTAENGEVNKDAAANLVQNLMHSALNK